MRRPTYPKFIERPRIPYPKESLTFYDRLYRLVDDPSSDSIISWSKSNKSFVIRNQEELVRRNMLRRLFHCSTLTEFISELKFNGFTQFKGSAGLLEFGDRNFVRGRPELMEKMHMLSVAIRSMTRSYEKKAKEEEKAKEEVKERLENLNIIMLAHTSPSSFHGFLVSVAFLYQEFSGFVIETMQFGRFPETIYVL